MGNVIVDTPLWKRCGEPAGWKSRDAVVEFRRRIEVQDWNPQAAERRGGL
jgi:hypothetical protein